MITFIVLLCVTDHDWLHIISVFDLHKYMKKLSGNYLPCKKMSVKMYREDRSD